MGEETGREQGALVPSCLKGLALAVPSRTGHSRNKCASCLEIFCSFGSEHHNTRKGSSPWVRLFFPLRPVDLRSFFCDPPPRVLP